MRTMSEFGHLTICRICRVNLETCLANLPLHLPASSDVIVALLFGVSLVFYISEQLLGANSGRLSMPLKSQNLRLLGHCPLKHQNYVRLLDTIEQSL